MRKVVLFKADLGLRCLYSRARHGSPSSVCDGSIQECSEDDVGKVALVSTGLGAGLFVLACQACFSLLSL